MTDDAAAILKWIDARLTSMLGTAEALGGLDGLDDWSIRALNALRDEVMWWHVIGRVTVDSIVVRHRLRTIRERLGIE